MTLTTIPTVIFLELVRQSVEVSDEWPQLSASEMTELYATAVAAGYEWPECHSVLYTEAPAVADHLTLRRGRRIASAPCFLPGRHVRPHLDPAGVEWTDSLNERYR